jgi:hypothetical protein
MLFVQNSAFRTADGFARCMMDCFDPLYEEGRASQDDGDQEGAERWTENRQSLDRPGLSVILFFRISE